MTGSWLCSETSDETRPWTFGKPGVSQARGLLLFILAHLEIQEEEKRHLISVPSPGPA
jgi:hypothetical protein